MNKTCGTCVYRSAIGDFCVLHGCYIKLDNRCDNFETLEEFITNNEKELLEDSEENIKREFFA